jgi:filamentous hemagglutinin family protein
MNRSYRHVWSAARGAYIIAAETARGRGKSGAAVKAAAPAPALSITLLAGAMLAGPAWGEVKTPTSVVPVAGKTNAYIAPNGVPVVNIDTANAAGISHNQFSTYNVEANGLVLNNTPFSKGAVGQSQLAGGVLGNTNLKDPAKIILNEVVSTNRSTLAGYTEVYGSRADVIVVNPNGLTCTGCGFINTDRVTLTTGAPVWAADGSIIGFNVKGGDIAIQGSGLNASAQQILDLVTRSVRLDGQVNAGAAGEIGIFTGAIQWSYAGRNIAGTVAVSDSKPQYAVDSTALGGMYAGRIRLIATEAGVGVRMLGDAAASADDFRVDAAGKVLVQSRISAAHDVRITQTGSEEAGQVEISGTNAALSAQHDLAIQADGGLLLNEATLKAVNNLSVRAASLADTSSAKATRTADAAVDLKLGGAAAIEGSTWGAGTGLDVDAASLQLANTTLYSGAVAKSEGSMRLGADGAIAMAGVKLTATAGLAVEARGAGLALDAGTALTGAADASLRAASTIDNAGSVQAGGGLAIGGGSAAAPLVLNNSGLLQAEGALGIGADRAARVANASAGRVLADRVAIQATTLDNAGTVQATSGMTIDASGALSNSGALLDTGAGKDMLLRAGSVSNTGTVQSAGDLYLASAGTLANSGKLLTTTAADGGSDGALAVQAGSLGNGGTIAAAGAATLTTAKGLENTSLIQGASLAATAGTALDNKGSGSLLAATGAVLYAQDVSNDGTVQAGTDLDINASAKLLNTGILQTLALEGDATLVGGSMINVGTIQLAGRAALVTTSGNLNNRGNVLVGRNLGVTVATTLVNTGAEAVLQAGGELSAEAADIVNDSAISAAGNLSARAANSLANAGLIETASDGTSLALTAATMSSSGSIKAGGSATLSAVNGSIENTGQATAAHELSLSASRDIGNHGATSLIDATTVRLGAIGIDNSGTVQAADSLRIDASGALTSSRVLQTTAAGSSLVVNAGTLANSGSLASSGSASLATAAGAMSNSGQIQAAGALALNTRTTIGNTGQIIGQAGVDLNGATGFGVTSSGRIQAAAGLTLGSASAPAAFATNSGTLFGDTAGIYAGNLSNSGRIQSNGAGTLSAATLSNLGSNSVILLGMDGGASSIAGSTSVRNEGAIHSAGDLSVSAPRLDNTGTGGISSEARLTMNASGNGFDNAGALYADTSLTVNAAGQLFVNNVTGTMDAHDIVVNAGTFNNYNTVIALGNTSITTSDAFNNLPTGRVPNIIIAQTIIGGTTLPQNWEGNCAAFDWGCDAEVTYSQSVTKIQGLDGAMPTQFGQIIAAGTIDISYGHSGLNQASLISAPNVNIRGSGSFTNTDLHLEQLEYERRWHMTKKGHLVGSDDYYYYYPTSDSQYGCNDGSCFGGQAGSDGEAAALATLMETNRTVIQKWKAGIYATNLTFSGGSLMNLGAPYQQGTASQAVGADSAASANPLAGTPLGSAFSAIVGQLPTTSKTVTVTAAPALQFQGLNLNLPTNPNGYFVVAKNPNSEFLVETNPLFGAGSNSVGSDYLTKLLNINPDQQIKRLGDANYEAKLVRDQLIAQTGNNVLKGMQSEAAQMQALMDNATTEAARLGLVYGKAPSPEQLANLKEDMVWMVETVVNGQKVVAPVVFLAQSTKDAIEGSGPVIAATNVKIDAGTVSNTGGTIAGDKLSITAKGDITNTGGTIKGGDVALKSTEGSIVNQTVAETHGGKDFARTTIGATGGIESTGTLSLDAAKDITVKGADVKAGGDASLAAGGNVTFDTIQDKRADKVEQRSAGFLGGDGSSSSTATTTNIGSGLTTGGNLSVKSGGATTIAGSQVKVGGDLAMDAKGGVNIVSRQDTKETSSSSEHSGIGTGGGLYGTTTTTTDTFQGRNVASGIEVKGNADIKTDGTLTLQGSTLKVDGSADIKADKVEVLAGQDVDRSTTTTKTTSFLKLDGGSAEASAGAGAEAGKGVGGVAGSGVGAEASAGASASASGGVTLAETTTTTSTDYNKRSVGSEISVGNKLTVTANKDITLEGAKVNAGGDTTLNAQDVKVLASQDVHTSSSKTTTTQVGLYVDSNNEATASAGAHAGMNTNAGAEAGVSSDTNIDLARTMTSQTDSLDIHNNGSTLNAGGKLTINAGNKLTVQGSDLSGDQGVDLKAKDMAFSATNDVSTTTSSSSKTSAGLYISGGASAEASAQAGMLGASASAGAEAKAGAGLQARHSEETESSGTTTANVSSIRSGNGSITRTAEGNITDVGTNIDAAGNFTQSATTIDSKAAANTSWSNSSSSSDQARLGVYAGAEAGAGASAGAGTNAGADAGASVGVEASYNGSRSSESASSSQAVVSNIRAGGKVSTTSTGTTTMEGTNISGGTGVEIGAKDLNYTAARNLETSSSSETNINASANIGVGVGTDTVEGGVSGGFDKSNSSASSSTAVTGSIQSGGGLTIKTGGDARFEGTNIDAAGDATVSAGGKLTMDAARDTSSETSSSSSFQAGVSVSGSPGKKSAGGGSEGGESSIGVELEGGYETSTSTSNQAVTGSVKSGGNLTLSSGSKASFEGTQIQADGATTVAAGSVEFKDAKSTSSSTEAGFSASLSAEASKEGDEKKGHGVGSLEAGFNSSSESSSTRTTISGGNGVQVKTGAAGISAAAAVQAAPAPGVAPAPAPAAAPAATSTGIRLDAAPVIDVAPRAIEAAPQARAGAIAVAGPLLADAGTAAPKSAPVSTVVAEPAVKAAPVKTATVKAKADPKKNKKEEDKAAVQPTPSK